MSMFFRILFQIIFIALPILMISSWLTATGTLNTFYGLIQVNFIPNLYLDNMLHPLSLSERLLALGVSAIPMIIYLYILFTLIQLFKLYEQGEIFSLQNVRYIRHSGYALLLTQIINPFYEGLMGLVLTWNNPPGHRFAGISLSHTNIGIVLIALVILLISWIMTEGCKLNEEQQYTI